MSEKLFTCEDCRDEAENPFHGMVASGWIYGSISSGIAFNSSGRTGGPVSGAWVFTDEALAQMHVVDRGHRVEEWVRSKERIEGISIDDLRRTR